MKTLQVKSIVIILIALLTSVNVFSQDYSYSEKDEYFEGQKRRALKVNFIGNFLGTTKLSYEQIHRPGRSFELKATFVERGKQGIFGSVGYKIFKKPTFIAPNMKRRHLLEGTYFKPEIFFGMAKDEDWTDAKTKAKAKSAYGVVLNIGKQWVFGDAIIIDTYFGTGVGTGKQIRGYATGKGLVLTGGLSFGFAF